MGYMTLADFREELSETTGNRGFDNGRLDRWINFAYMDVTGAIDLEELEEPAAAVTVAATPTVAKPDNSRKVLTVVDDTTGRLLQSIDKTEYFRLDRTTTGEPLKWAVLGDNIYLHPTPNAAFDLLIIQKIDPARLELVSDTTILADTWDAAVFMLSVHYAYMSVGEDQRAALWMNRAISYLQSRATAEEIFIREPGLGLSMAVPKERLLSAMQGGISGNVGS
jgi:hypothetical protein